ncbi:MAG: hypothetical protein WKF57_04065 [Nakamurella sp.]
MHLPELKQVVVADLLIRAYRSGINHVSGGCRSRRLTRTAHSGGVVHLINRRFLSSRHLVGSAVLALALTVSAASLVSGASAPVGAAFSPQQGVVAPTVVAATSGSAASPVPGVRFVGSGDWATPNGRSDGSRWNAVERPITVGSVAAVSELWRSDDGFIQSQEEWLAAGELLIFRGGDGMVAVDAATGQRRWEFSGGVQSMNAVGSSLYIRGYRTGVGSTTGVMALDLTSGRTRWSTPTDVNGSPYGTNLVTAGGLLVGTYFDGSVRAFRLSDGRLMWRTAGLFLGQATIDGSTVVVGAALSRDIGLRTPVVLSLRTGKVLWQGSGGGFLRGLTARSGSIWAIAGRYVYRWNTKACLGPDAPRICQPEWVSEPIMYSPGQNATGPIELFAVGTNATTFFARGEPELYKDRVYGWDLFTGALRWSGWIPRQSELVLSGTQLLAESSVGNEEVPRAEVVTVYATAVCMDCVPLTRAIIPSAGADGSDRPTGIIVGNGRLHLRWDNKMVTVSLPSAAPPSAPTLSPPIWTPSGGTPFRYGTPTDRPWTGDWNGDGRDTPGGYRGGKFFAQNQSGTPDTIVTWSSPGATPVVGDWNGDGRSTVGLWKAGAFQLRDTLTNSGARDTTIQYGRTGDLPFVGDWNGDGRTDMGYKRGNVYYLRYLGSFRFGSPTDTPVIGDWNGDGTDTIGLKRGNTYLLSNDNKTVAYTVTAGLPADVAVAGDFAGDGTTELTTVRRIS